MGHNRLKLKGIISPALPSLATLLLSGCFQSPFTTTASISAPAGAVGVVQGTTDSGGRTSGAYDPNATYPQQLAASAGDIAGTSVIFPPGALSFAITISMESGASLADGSALADLNLALSNAVTSSGASVIIRPSEDATLLVPMSLSIPLPAGFGLVGLSLDEGTDDNRLAILAKVFDANGELMSKLIPRKNITIENGNAKFDTMAFGAFQTVVMEQPVTEAAEARTTEPVANKNGVAVITTTGVVAASEIAAAEQKKPLTIQTFTASFAAPTRKLTIASKLSESVQIKACSLTLRDVSTKAVRFSGAGAKDESTDSVSAQIAIPEEVEGNLEAAISCESKDGRIARSDWTAIGTVPKYGFGLTSFAPKYFSSTREVKINGEMSKSTAAIESCTFNFRVAAAPGAVIYEATRTPGTTASGPILLPYNIEGAIEIMASCTFVDKSSASTSWTNLGTVAQGADGTVTIDADTGTSARISWSMSSGTPQNAEFKVERAPTLEDFKTGSSAIVMVADWARAESSSNGSLMETTASNLTPGTTYFFRVASRDLDCMTCNVLYFPVAARNGVSSGSGNAAAGGSAGGGGGNFDLTPPTLKEFASVSRLAPGLIELRTGWAYDNATPKEQLKYKIVFSENPISDVAGLNAASATVFRDWNVITTQTIGISNTPTALRYYTLGVKDAAGNIALHPSLALMLPGASMPTIAFNSDIALNMSRFPFVYGFMSNSGSSATTLNYKIWAGTKPGLSDLIAAPSTPTTISLPPSGPASFSLEPILPVGTSLTLGTTYYANLQVLDQAGSEIARLYAPARTVRPMAFFEFENDGLNTGESAAEASAAGQNVPYPATLPTGFNFDQDQKMHGSYSAKLNGSQVIEVPALNLLNVVSATGVTGVTGFTMGGWVYQTSTPTAGIGLFGIDNFLEFGLGQGGAPAIYIGALNLEIPTATSLPLNSWHHVVVSGRAGNGTAPGRIAIFVDGNLKASASVPPASTRFDEGAVATDFVKIGGGVWDVADTRFTGYMDDVFFSPWTFSDNAIRQMSQ